MNSSDVPYTAGYALELLRDMLRIRRLEERAAELYGEGRIRGSCTSTSAKRR